ncbi:MAG TPA: hypothetical protein P5157_04215 [Paludibacteraceae bacterium]|nr:hypothetical protein [Paludibacteraceae bacterium]HRS24089.1 hypothetical protein [Paludibacteraceae bacterium]HRT78927.1 hypothetical protein [Paludibacteraceae bacterium]
MNQTTDKVTITYPITAKKADGQTVTFNLIQTITKSLKGEPGEDGENGTNGLDGNFIEYRYAKNGSTSTAPSIVVTDLAPSGWEITPPSTGLLEYLWMTKAKKNYSGTQLLESWSTPVRIKGDIGDKGDVGASPVYQGVYSSHKTYYGTSQRVDIVQYNSNYYVARVDAGTFSNIVPTDTSKWNLFGAQFESIATNLLLAEGANIADWIIADGKITAQATTDDDTPRAKLDGVNGKINFASDIDKYTEDGDSESVKQEISIDSLNGKIEVRTSDYDVSYMNSQGIFTNRAGIQALPASSGIELKAAVVALGFGDLKKDAYYNKGAICGVYGSSLNNNSDPAPSYGGYFDKLRANGLYLNCRQINSSTTLTQNDVIISLYNTSTITITLPSSTYTGQIILLRINNNSSINISGNGNSIMRVDGAIVTNVTVGTRGELIFLIWDGQYWLYSTTEQ